MSKLLVKLVLFETGNIIIIYASVIEAEAQRTRDDRDTTQLTVIIIIIYTIIYKKTTVINHNRIFYVNILYILNYFKNHHKFKKKIRN